MDLPNAPFYRRWSFILAGVIGVAAITALLGWRGLQETPGPATTFTTLPPTTSPAPPTTTPPTSQEHTSKPAATGVLWEGKGGDTVTSQGFQAPATWRIVWSFDCSNFKKYGGGNFKITGNGAFEQIQIQDYKVRARGSTIITRGGYGRLLVDSVCRRWSVKALSG